MTTEEKFQAAVNIIRSLPKDGPYQPSHGMMLKFYGLYKQAVEGPCTEPKPAFYEVVKGYKWQAWNSLGNMTKTEAKHCYVDELKKIIETMSYTENVANFMDTLGPFYEYVDIPGKKKLNNNTPEDPPPLQPPLPTPHGDLSDSGSEVSDGSGGDHGCGDVVNGMGGERGEHDGDTSSAPPTPLQSPPLPQNDVRGDVVEEEASQDKEDEGSGTINTISALAAAVTKRVLSDSDSDEEYSEPAEQLITDQDHHHHYHNRLPPPPPLPPQCKPMSQRGEGEDTHPRELPLTSAGKTRREDYTYAVTSMSGVINWGTNTPTAGAGAGAGAEGGTGGGRDRIGGGGGQGGRDDGGGGGGGGGGRLLGRSVEEEVNVQVMAALQRLQTDMTSVLHRLDTLQALTLTQREAVCARCQGNNPPWNSNKNSRGHSWWPLPELSPRSTFLLLLWPVFLHTGFRLLLPLLLRWRRKHRSI